MNVSLVSLGLNVFFVFCCRLLLNHRHHKQERKRNNTTRNYENKKHNFPFKKPLDVCSAHIKFNNIFMLSPSTSSAPISARPPPGNTFKINLPLNPLSFFLKRKIPESLVEMSKQLSKEFNFLHVVKMKIK